jgi:mRNA-degrading endonuclease RelE of RelBE toxin-antitoxin system
MTYELRYSPKAQVRMLELPAEFLELVFEHLGKLAEHPTKVSIPTASPPFPPHGQLYHFHLFDSIGDWWFFTIIFQYTQDESALYILSITWREMIEQRDS